MAHRFKIQVFGAVAAALCLQAPEFGRGLVPLRLSRRPNENEFSAEKGNASFLKKRKFSAHAAGNDVVLTQKGGKKSRGRTMTINSAETVGDGAKVKLHYTTNDGGAAKSGELTAKMGELPDCVRRKIVRDAQQRVQQARDQHAQQQVRVQQVRAQRVQRSRAQRAHQARVRQFGERKRAGKAGAQRPALRAVTNTRVQRPGAPTVVRDGHGGFAFAVPKVTGSEEEELEQLYQDAKAAGGQIYLRQIAADAQEQRDLENRVNAMPDTPSEEADLVNSLNDMPDGAAADDEQALLDELERMMQDDEQ